jgi:hypothetical protein
VGTKGTGGHPFLGERVEGVALFQLRRKKILPVGAFLGGTLTSQTAKQCSKLL